MNLKKSNKLFIYLILSSFIIHLYLVYVTLSSSFIYLQRVLSGYVRTVLYLISQMISSISGIHGSVTVQNN